jgi:hypothetical protein
MPSQLRIEYRRLTVRCAVIFNGSAERHNLRYGVEEL